MGTKVVFYVFLSKKKESYLRDRLLRKESKLKASRIDRDAFKERHKY